MWCGPEVWDNEILQSDIPALPYPRKFILWDNWIAVDSAQINKLTIDPPKSREKALVDNINQFWLNLNFPSSFMVPAIASLSRVQADGESNYQFYWENERKIYENEEKINNVLKFDSRIWCEYFDENCSEEQISAYYELLRGINWMKFDSAKIKNNLLESELVDLADEIKKRQ